LTKIVFRCKYQKTKSIAKLFYGVIYINSKLDLINLALTL